MDNGFTIKDSGKREKYDSGMRRDTQDDKPRYDLIIPENMKNNMLKRWAIHMTKGAVKYGERNWELAKSKIELARFRASAVRHFAQWWMGEVDEDHASEVFFNIQAFEYVKEKFQEESEVLIVVPFAHNGTEWYSKFMGIQYRVVQDEDNSKWRVVDMGGTKTTYLLDKKNCHVIGKYHDKS